MILENISRKLNSMIDSKIITRKDSDLIRTGIWMLATEINESILKNGIDETSKDLISLCKQARQATDIIQDQ